MISLPSKQTRRWNASNDSDVFGHIIRSRNLDFNKKGYLSLARKADAIYTEAEDADFQTPIVITNNDNNYYVVTSDHCYSLDIFGATPGVADLEGGDPPSFGFDSDAVFFNGADIHVSGGSEIASYNGGSDWTERYGSLSSSWPHPMCVSEHQQLLAVGNGNSVILLAAAGPPYTVSTTCTVPVGQIVTWIRWKGNLLYFGTRNIYGGNGRMYIWNGSGTAAQAGYDVGSEWCMSGTLYEDTIVVASLSGQLLKFTGNGFSPLRTDDGREAAFPIYNSGIPWGTSNSNSNLLSNIASRGMIAKGRRISMMVDSTNQSESNHLINFPSGLWVFDPTVGLYHKAGVDHKRVQIVKPTTSAVSGNTIVLQSAANYETGDSVFFHSVNGLSGPSDSKTYYAIKIDSTNLKLAMTPAQAVAGAAISITGTADTFDVLQFSTYQSVGSVKVERGGPVHLISKVLPQGLASEVIFGCETHNSTGTSVGAVMLQGLGKNVGSFITAKIQAASVTDVFKKLISKFPPLDLTQQQIIIKYRTSKRFGAPGRRGGAYNTGSPVTWVNSTSFTINPLAYDAYVMQVGDEVEFIKGAAAGYTAHITDITIDSASQWTITIDETMPDVTASDTSDFFFDNWTKYKVINTTEDAKAAAKGFQNAALAKNGKWVQLKIELRGFPILSSDTGEDPVDLEELMLVNGADQKYA